MVPKYRENLLKLEISEWIETKIAKNSKKSLGNLTRFGFQWKNKSWLLMEERASSKMIILILIIVYSLEFFISDGLSLEFEW